MEDRDLKRRVVIGITGLVGAGKTTAAEYLVSRHSFDCIRYSQVLAEWFNESPDSKSQLQMIGWEVMSGGRQAELNRRLIARMAAENDWCVDGLRHPLDYESLKSRFASTFHLVYIECPQEERWLRLQRRGRFHTFEEFRSGESKPVEQHIPHLKSVAEVCIANTGRVENLFEAMSVFIASIRKENA